MGLVRAALRFHLTGRVEHLIVYPTGRCPFSCRMCFVGEEMREVDLERGPLERFLRALGPVEMVDIGGGEPFLRPDLRGFLRLFRRAGSVGIPTSGWDPPLVVARVREALAEVGCRRLYICVSLDGFPSTNDRLRGPGAFEGAAETLSRLLAIPRLRVKLNTVLSAGNIAEVGEFMRFVRGRWGDRLWFHSVLLLRGNPRDPACGPPPVGDIERVLPEVLRVQEEYPALAGLAGRFRRNYLRLLWSVSLRVLQGGGQVVRCLAGRAHLVVWPNGDVSPCELLPAVGNIYRQGPRTILGGRALEEAVADIRTGRCACTHNCNMVENILFDPRWYPHLLGLVRLTPSAIGEAVGDG